MVACQTAPEEGKQESDLQNCMRYLRDEAKLALSAYEQWPEWPIIDTYRIVRNCLTHDGGSVPDEHLARLRTFSLIEIDQEAALRRAIDPSVSGDMWAHRRNREGILRPTVQRCRAASEREGYAISVMSELFTDDVVRRLAAVVRTNVSPWDDGSSGSRPTRALAIGSSRRQLLPLLPLIRGN